MYIVDFEYDNRRLSDFGFMVGHIDDNSGVKQIDVGCDITFETVKNNHSSAHSITSSKYDSVYKAEFEIIKISCKNNHDDVYTTPLELRDLIRWLNVRGHYKFKPFDTNSDGLDVSYYGSFNIKELAIAGRLVGLSLSFTSNAPHGFDDVIELQFETYSENETITIYGDSDDSAIIYPDVSVRCLTDGTLRISNLTSGNSLVVENCSANETITFDGEHKLIVTDNESHKETLYDDFKYDYLDILIERFECENIYEVSIPCEISISYLPLRKVGIY